MVRVTDALKASYPDALLGVLVMRAVANPSSHDILDEQKTELEERLRSRYRLPDTIKDSPILKAYTSYYHRFKKTYHVQHQLESIVTKSKSIPRVSALVEAMFMAEINNLLLTAGHDMDSIRLPINLDISIGTENYILLRGGNQILKAGDMMITDEEGVISSIIYGPDQRTQIREQTKNVMFTVYAPPGINDESVRVHLEEIERNVNLISPESKTEMLKVFNAR